MKVHIPYLKPQKRGFTLKRISTRVVRHFSPVWYLNALMFKDTSNTLHEAWYEVFLRAHNPDVWISTHSMSIGLRSSVPSARETLLVNTVVV